MERVIFPIHTICEYLTPETKQNIFTETERDAQGSKVSDLYWRCSLIVDIMWERFPSMLFSGVTSKNFPPLRPLQ